MNKSLYEINKEYIHALEQGFIVDEETGEIFFDKEALEKIDGDFKEKADNIACYIKDLEAFTTALDTEKKALDKRLKANKEKVSQLKEYLSQALNLREINKLETARNKITFRKSTSVDVLDEDAIDFKYFKEVVEKKLDKKTLLADLKKGAEVQGARLLEKQNIQVK